MLTAGVAAPMNGTPSQSSRGSPSRSAKGSPPRAVVPHLDLASHFVPGSNVEVRHLSPRQTSPSHVYHMRKDSTLSEIQGASLSIRSANAAQEIIQDYDDKGVGITGPRSGRRSRRKGSRLAGDGAAADARASNLLDELRGGNVRDLQSSYLETGQVGSNKNGCHHIFPIDQCLSVVEHGSCQSTLS